jgi:hypothetical protein
MTHVLTPHFRGIRDTAIQSNRTLVFVVVVAHHVVEVVGPHLVSYDEYLPYSSLNQIGNYGWYP